MRVTRMMVANVLVRPAWRGHRIAQDDRKPPVEWGEHEPRRNERPQTEHHKDEWRGPATHATQPRPVRSSFHGPFTIPKGSHGSKYDIGVRITPGTLAVQISRASAREIWTGVVRA